MCCYCSPCFVFLRVIAVFSFFESENRLYIWLLFKNNPDVSATDLDKFTAGLKTVFLNS